MYRKLAIFKLTRTMYNDQTIIAFVYELNRTFQWYS